MKESEDKKEGAIYWRVPEWFKDLKEAELVRFKFFHHELVRFNKSINLISAKSIFEADLVHFADCILASKLILENCKKKKIFDLGCGNGFPGLILSILDTEREYVLVESDTRKSEFLKHMINKFEFGNVSVQNMRIEDLPANSVECGVSRGFAQVAKALLTTRKIFKIGGHYYHIKGDHWTVELAGIPSQLCSSWEPALLSQYKLPIGGKIGAVVVTTKIS